MSSQQISRWEILREVGRMAASAGITLTKFALLFGFIAAGIVAAAAVVLWFGQYIPSSPAAWMAWTDAVPQWIWTFIDVLGSLLALVLYLLVFRAVWITARRRVQERDSDAE